MHRYQVSKHTLTRTIKNGILKYCFEIHNPKGRNPLVVMQGFTATKETFLGFPDHVSQQSNHQRSIINVDHRGIGESIIYRNNKIDTNPEITLEDMADDVKYLMDHFTINDTKISKIDLLGMSMGGMVAQVFANRYPQHLRKLILMSTTPGFGDYLPFDGVELKRLFELSQETTELETTTNLSLSDDEKRQRIEEIEYEIRRCNLGDNLGIDEEKQIIDRITRVYNNLNRPLGTIAAQAKAINQFNNLDNLKNIQVPTLILHGSGDKLLDIKNAQLMSNEIQNNVFINIKNQGHEIFAIEKMSVFLAECVNQFLDNPQSDKVIDLAKLCHVIGCTSDDSDNHFTIS